MAATRDPTRSAWISLRPKSARPANERRRGLVDFAPPLNPGEAMPDVQWRARKSWLSALDRNIRTTAPRGTAVALSILQDAASGRPYSRSEEKMADKLHSAQRTRGWWCDRQGLNPRQVGAPVAVAADEASRFIREHIGDAKISAVDPPACRTTRIAFCRA
jgi:hypothetical protein